ncbi:MAG TPA: hypothetical protein VFV33_26795 [Gemmatimonadaceae bacterium]|nr:hypothetical protein [Gemmatimonadaceae bacterium]
MTARRLQPTRHAAHTLLTAPDFNVVALRLHPSAGPVNGDGDATDRSMPPSAAGGGADASVSVYANRRVES